MKFVFLLSFIPVIAFGQQSHKVVNANTKDPVPYATVGFKNAKMWLTSDEKGDFMLDIDAHANDTLFISSVGYKPLKIAVSNILNFIELEENSMSLKEVRLHSGKMQNEVRLNEFANCGNDLSSTTGYITQVAKFFEAPVENAMLTDVYVCTSGGSATFRLRVYAMDTLTKAPSYDLIDTVVQIKTSKRRIHIPLESYHVYLQEKEFFVAIEWLKIPENEYKTKFKNEILTTYMPYLSTKPISQKFKNNFRPNMQLDFFGNWQKYDLEKDLKLSVRLKY